MHRDLVTLYFLSLTSGRSEDKVSFLQRIFKEHGEQVDYFVGVHDTLQVAGDLTKMFSTGIAPEWLIAPVVGPSIKVEEIPGLAVVEEENKD